LLPSGGFFVSGLPTLAFHGINSDSAGNYQLIDMESTVRMGFPQGITQLRDKKSTRGRGFQREIPAYLLEFRPVRSKLAENPWKGNNSRIISSKSYILKMPTLKKFKYEGLFKMKNKPDPFCY
jgi:hypothetical protein